jgi:Zn-dependent metalloprotease
MQRAFAVVKEALRVGLAGFAVAITVAWLGLGILQGRGGVVGLAMRRLGSGLAGAVTTLAASMGAPVTWRLRGFGVHGQVRAVTLLAHRPLWLVGALLLPLIAAVTVGWLASAAARRAAVPRRVMLLASAMAFATITAAAVLVAGRLGQAGPVVVQARSLAATGLAFAWAAALGWLGLGLHAVVAARRPRMGAGAARARRRVALSTTAALVGFSAFVPAAVPASAPAIQGGPGGQPAARPRPAPVGYQRPGVKAALQALERESGARFRVSQDWWRGAPALIGADSPVGAGVMPWLQAHAGVLGASSLTGTLRRTRSWRDGLGWRHDRYEQVVQGVPVYHAWVTVHRDASGRRVRAITTGFRPDLRVAATRPTLSAAAAVTAAKRALPQAKLIQPAALYLYPADPEPNVRAAAPLVWQVWLSDDAHGVSKVYFVDARSPGTIIAVEDRTENAKQREVFDLLNQGWDSPNPSTGLVPKRAEGDPPYGIVDVDQGYNAAGATYDYYWLAHHRDSFDGAGGTMILMVRWQKDMRNAQWDGAETKYGVGFATYDIVGHEFTHAVTQYTAGLEYQYQSGALNESYSDIFGEMVEEVALGPGANDWLIGEGVPGGPLRDMAHPANHGQPENFKDYVLTCADQGGVHTNSGIQNRAFYLLAQAIGSAKAKQIAYRALSQYLGPKTNFITDRYAWWFSADDLYGKSSPEVAATLKAWADVGVDQNSADPPKQNCPCLGPSSLNGSGQAGLDPAGPTAAQVLATLSEANDVLGREPAGSHYLTVYYSNGNADRSVQLLASNDQLSRKVAHALQTFQPAIQAVLDGKGATVTVTRAMIDEANSVLDAYAAADVAAGGGALAGTIAHERSLVDLNALVGLTADRARAALNQQFASVSGGG